MSKANLDPSPAELAVWKQAWGTPEPFVAWVERMVLPEFNRRYFTLDACATPWNAKCPAFIAPHGTAAVRGMIGWDGLQTDWDDHVVWVNAGFRGLGAWVARCVEMRRKAAVICHLTHAAHSAAWSQLAIREAWACWRVHPRIQFLQDPRYRDYLQRLGKKPSGNARDSYLWVYWQGPPVGGRCRVVDPGAWK